MVKRALRQAGGSMNAPAKIHPSAREKIDAFLARVETNRATTARTWKIVDRLLPEIKPVNGFTDPAGFIASSRRRGERKYLAYIVEAFLIAKRDRTYPRVGVPKDGCVSDNMVAASKALQANAAEALSDALERARELRTGQELPAVTFVDLRRPDNPSQGVAA